MFPSTSILMFGENPNDAVFVSNELARQGMPVAVRMASEIAGVEASAHYAAVIVINEQGPVELQLLLRSIRRSWPRSQVVVLLDQFKDEAATEMLAGGLADFVVRPSADMDDLLAIIWTSLALAGETRRGGQSDINRNHRLDRSVAGFFRCYRDGRLFDVNTTMARLLGYAERESSVLAGHMLWPEEAPPQLQRATEASPVDFQARLRRIDKRPCWGRLVVWPVSTASGRIVAFEGWVEDLTQCHLCHAGFRESSAIQRAVLETPGTAIAVMSQTGALTLVNPEFERMSGYSKGELLGKMSGFAFVAPDELKRVERHHAVQMAGERKLPVTYERRFVNRAGEVRHTQVTVQLIPGTRRVLESIVDVTEKRQSERSMKLLAEGLVKRGDDVFVQLAASLAETLGVDAVLIAETIGQPPRSLRLLGTRGPAAEALWPAGEISLQDSLWRDLIEGKRLVFVCTSQARSAHPEDRWLQAVEAESFIGLPLCANDGRKIGLIAIASRRALQGIRFQKYAMQLVGKQAMAELAGRRSTVTEPSGAESSTPIWLEGAGQDGSTNLPRLLSTALDQTADHVLITDHQGTICYVNRAFTVETGYAREEVIGRTPRILRSGQHSIEFYGEMWRRLHAGEVFQGEFVNRRKQGDLFWEAKTITPIRNRLGRISYFVSTARNITEHKKIEEQMRHTQRLEAVGRLAGGVAHDFNNLLTAIMGFSSLALSSMNPDHPAWNDIGQTRRAGERATALTRQLLAFSRRQILNPQVLDPNEVLQSLEQMLRRLLPETIELRVVLSPEVGRIKTDRDQIELALVNLVVNARDAMPAGGRLTLGTDNLPPVERTSAPFNRAGSFVHLSVSDTGCGMDAETKRHIFEPFFTTKPVEKGTGLGLATVYGIVTQSGGFISVDSEPDRGSTFHVYLPQVNEPLSLAPAKPCAVLEGGRETILLVEDDADIRQFAVRALRDRGYVVHAAENGLAAQALLGLPSAPQVDLLITDVVMPLCGGIELVAALRRLRPQLPVLFISGYAECDLDQSGLKPGEIHSLHKPFEPDALVGKIHEVLRLSREQAGAGSGG